MFGKQTEEKITFKEGEKMEFQDIYGTVKGKIFKLKKVGIEPEKIYMSIELLEKVIAFNSTTLNYTVQYTADGYYTMFGYKLIPVMHQKDKDIIDVAI
jgi:hypothetical protein